MPTYSTEFAEALVPGIYKHWQLGVESVDSKVPQLFDIRSSSRAWEEMVAVGGFDPAPFLQYEQTGQIGQLDFRKGYTKRFIHREYPANIVVERKFVDDGGLDETAFNPARRAGIAYMIFRERMAAALYINAFGDDASGEKLPDGKWLCDTSRPAGPSNTGQTWGNKGTSAFSAAALRAARQKMMRFQDDRGQLRPSIGRLILAAPELEESVMQVSMSSVDTNSGNSLARDVASPERSMNYQRVIWPYLTNEKDWWLIDPTLLRESAVLFERVQPEIRYEPSKSNQVQICYSCYMRFSIGFVDGRFIYGNDVA